VSVVGIVGIGSDRIAGCPAAAFKAFAEKSHDWLVTRYEVRSHQFMNLVLVLLGRKRVAIGVTLKEGFGNVTEGTVTEVVKEAGKAHETPFVIVAPGQRWPPASGGRNRFSIETVPAMLNYCLTHTSQENQHIEKSPRPDACLFGAGK
jgi:hypothetical protein